jgi:hypothetical protein
MDRVRGPLGRGCDGGSPTLTGMRRITTTALLVGAVALAASTGAGVAGPRRGCPPSHTRFVKQNRIAKLYDRRESSDRYFGVCLRRSRARMFLAFDGLDVEGLAALVPFIRLRNTHVATVEGYAGDVNPGQFWVDVYDISKPRRISRSSRGREVGFRREAKRVRHASAYPGARYNRVRSFVFGPGATACWIGEALESHAFQVHCLGRNGDRTLDEGAGIDSDSLRLHGSTLTWQRDGATRTAGIGP